MRHKWSLLVFLKKAEYYPFYLLARSAFLPLKMVGLLLRKDIYRDAAQIARADMLKRLDMASSRLKSVLMPSSSASAPAQIGCVSGGFDA